MVDYSVYDKALKMGQRAARAARLTGENPYLPALDSFLRKNDVQAEVDMGIMDVPLDLIVGTKTVGRQKAFANNFMPLVVGKRSEFTQKWVNVYQYQLDNGVCDPIVAYEYLNRYYVMEGNKRVSIFKFVNAYSIEAKVIRIIPKKSEDPKVKIFYEYMEFYRRTRINYLQFTKEGSYDALTAECQKGLDEQWTESDCEVFSSRWTRFLRIYDDVASDAVKKKITAGDAFLLYLSVYGYTRMDELSETQLKTQVQSLKNEFSVLGENPQQALVMEAKNEDAGLFSSFLSRTGRKEIMAGFVHARVANHSGWVYGHELGRSYLADKFGDKIKTKDYYISEDDSLTQEAYEENIDNVIGQAVADGCGIVFTTSEVMLDASLRAAIKHPNVRILNCSVNRPYKSMRTYFGRMYEAKFLEGMIAGAAAENDRIAYLADYPIYGTFANINAFAMGAAMVNPRAVITLEWYADKDLDLEKTVREKQIEVISGVDMMRRGSSNRKYGLYTQKDGEVVSNLALPMWNWGVFYEKILRDILGGTWSSSKGKEHAAVNYWWGISSDIIDLMMSRSVPQELTKLIKAMRQSISSDAFHPFEGPIRDQSGVVRVKSGERLSPEEIITMDWLCSNVDGKIPEFDQMTDIGKRITSIQGILKTVKDEDVSGMKAKAAAQFIVTADGVQNVD